MIRPCVVILSNRSLFSQGVVSRLREHVHQLELVVLDPGREDVVEQITDSQPTAVILDASDTAVAQLCPLSVLLSTAPGAKVVRLNPYNDQIQVITSEQRVAEHVHDLVEVISSIE
jgi:DNA-binding NarL/FixJ family response regulator